MTTKTLSNTDTLRLINAAKAAMNKKYGNETFLDPQNMHFNAVTSGSAVIDDVLGNNGFVSGRMHMIYGAQSSGKCLTKDTRIMTPHGFKTIEQIFNECNINLDVTSSNDVVIPCSYSLINEYCEVERTTHFTINGYKPTISVYTVNSATPIRATHNHPLRVIDQYGLIVWKHVENIKVGDYLVSPIIEGIYLSDSSLDCFNDDNLNLGMFDSVVTSLVSSGWLTKERFNKNTYFNDLKINWASQHTLSKPLTFKDRITYVLYYLSFLPSDITEDLPFTQQLIDYTYEVFGVLLGDSANKTHLRAFRRIQEILNTANHYSLLSTLNERLQSYINNKHLVEPEYCTLPPQISNLFVRVVEQAPVTTKIRNQLFNVISNKKPSRNVWSNILETLNKNLEGDWSPYLQELIETVNSVVYSNIYYKVNNVVHNNKLEPTYDFAMEETSSFIANGFRSHNTSVSTSTAASFQRKHPDKFVLYIDAENAFVPEYAQALGLDVSPERLIISQESSAEAVFDIIDTFVKTGCISLVVLDSIPALLTKAQLEKGYGEATMASLANFLTTALNKIKSLLVQYDTTVIFINQTRNSLNMYGPSTSIPGGQALKFYCSTISKVTKRDNIVDGEEIIGQDLEFKNEKNKVASPFKVGLTKLIFYKGFSIPDEVAELASKKGIITRGGAWYSWQGSQGQEIKVQGMASVVKMITDNEAELEHLQAKIKELGGPSDKLSQEEIQFLKEQEKLDEEAVLAETKK